jgi:transposase
VIHTALEVYPGIMKKCVLNAVLNPPKLKKTWLESLLFTMRWVIERSNAWVERCKSLVKNFEANLDNPRANLNVCFIRFMLRRLVKLC